MLSKLLLANPRLAATSSEDYLYRFIFNESSVVSYTPYTLGFRVDNQAPLANYLVCQAILESPTTISDEADASFRVSNNSLIRISPTGNLNLFKTFSPSGIDLNLGRTVDFDIDSIYYAPTGVSTATLVSNLEFTGYILDDQENPFPAYTGFKIEYSRPSRWFSFIIYNNSVDESYSCTASLPAGTDLSRNKFTAVITSGTANKVITILLNDSPLVSSSPWSSNQTIALGHLELPLFNLVASPVCALHELSIRNYSILE
jgi:hypothetical protein